MVPDSFPLHMLNIRAHAETTLCILVMSRTHLMRPIPNADIPPTSLPAENTDQHH